MGHRGAADFEPENLIVQTVILGKTQRAKWPFLECPAQLLKWKQVQLLSLLLFPEEFPENKLR